MTQDDFAAEVGRKVLTSSHKCPFTREELVSIMQGAVRDCIRHEIGEALSPIRQDIRDIEERQAERDKVCAAETQRTATHDTQLKKLWEKQDQGDQCKGCINRDRITTLEVNLKTLMTGIYILASSTAGLILKSIVDVVRH